MAKTPFESIVFPALCVARDHTISVAHSSKDLSRCSARALWDERYFDGLVVLDAAAGVFTVKGAAADGAPGWLARAAARLRNAEVSVELDVIANGRTPLTDIRRRVGEAVTARANLPEPTPELKDWLVRISDSRTMAELISLFY